MKSPLPPAPRPLLLALAATWPLLATGQTGTGQPVAPKVTVSATRIESAEDEVPATVSSKTATEIERAQARDLKTLLDGEAGIAVRRQPARMSAVFGATGRGGNEGINVRGLEGNQVMLQVDGVRLPMSYESGPFMAGRGDSIDLEAYKRVELLRGPSSASYGSDGLAGAVSFVTKDPEDLLTLGRSRQGSLKLGHATSDRSWVAVPSFALRERDWEAMLLASLRRGHEESNRGELDTRNFNATVPNPQQRRSDYLLGKALYRLDAAHAVQLTLEHLRRRVDTDPIFTVAGMPNVNANVIDARASEQVARDLGKLNWQYRAAQSPWVQRASAWVYAQNAQTHQFGQERYNSPPASWGRRTRDTTYREDSRGAGFQAESAVGDDLDHRVLWGADASQTHITSLREGAHFDAAGNLIVGGSTSASASFPNQSFPTTDQRMLGAFVQDELALGRWRLVPALRYDRFDIEPEAGNPLFTRNNSVPPSRLSGHALSPRLGLVWQAGARWHPYAQWAEGFRAPTPWQINGGISNLSNAANPYRTIGNPDLKPEHSRSLELGLRYREGPMRWSVAAFHARYRDFIVSNVNVTSTTAVPLEPGMPANTQTYQSVNAAQARIRGVEVQLAWQIAPGWTVEASHARAVGDQQDATGQRSPLPTIEPDKGTLTVRHQRARGFGAELTLVGQESQKRPHRADLVVPKGYFTADLAAWWSLSPTWHLNLAVTNLGDAQYATWADVRGLETANARVADAFTQPGRQASLSVRHEF